MDTEPLLRKESLAFFGTEAESYGRVWEPLHHPRAVLRPPGREDILTTRHTAQKFLGVEITTIVAQVLFVLFCGAPWT